MIVVTILAAKVWLRNGSVGINHLVSDCDICSLEWFKVKPLDLSKRLLNMCCIRQNLLILIILILCFSVEWLRNLSPQKRRGGLSSFYRNLLCSWTWPKTGQHYIGLWSTCQLALQRGYGSVLGKGMRIWVSHKH